MVQGKHQRLVTAVTRQQRCFVVVLRYFKARQTGRQDLGTVNSTLVCLCAFPKTRRASKQEKCLFVGCIGLGWGEAITFMSSYRPNLYRAGTRCYVYQLALALAASRLMKLLMPCWPRWRTCKWFCCCSHEAANTLFLRSWTDYADPIACELAATLMNLQTHWIRNTKGKSLLFASSCFT